MKYKNEFLIGLIAVLFLIAGCQGSENEENTENTDRTENEVTEEIENENSDNDADVYERTQKNPNYLIETQVFDKEKKLLYRFLYQS